MKGRWPLIVGVVIAGVFIIRGSGGSSTPAVALNCIGGSEKTTLMADPDVTKILHDRYHLAVNFTPLGSYDQVQLTTAELKQRGVDCLWPSSQSAQSVFEKLHNTAVDFPGYQANLETLKPLELPAVPVAGAAQT